MLKQAKKWVKDSFKPYKYGDQKTRDQLQLIDGIVNFVVGFICLVFKLINLMLIVPVKALISDCKNFTNKYNEIGNIDVNTLAPTFRRFITGIIQILTSPIIPFRIIIRLFLTPSTGVSVFANEGLKNVVNEYFDANPKSELSNILIDDKDTGSSDLLKSKAQKYINHNQKDGDKLERILLKPTLTYFKMKEIRKCIQEEGRTTKTKQALQ